MVGVDMKFLLGRMALFSGANCAVRFKECTQDGSDLIKPFNLMQVPIWYGTQFSEICQIQKIPPRDHEKPYNIYIYIYIYIYIHLFFVGDQPHIA